MLVFSLVCLLLPPPPSATICTKIILKWEKISSSLLQRQNGIHKKYSIASKVFCAKETDRIYHPDERILCEKNEEANETECSVDSERDYFSVVHAPNIHLCKNVYVPFVLRYLISTIAVNQVVAFAIYVSPL